MRIISYICAVLLIQACAGSTEKKETRKPAAPPPVPVHVMVAELSESANSIFSPGTVLADQEVELRSEIQGKISQIYFKEGAEVKKGQLLVRLDNSEIAAQLQKAYYDKDMLAKKEFRQKKLLDIKAISQEEYEQSLNQLNATRSQIALLAAQSAKTRIRAPFSGTIGLKSVDVGTTVSPSTPIASLQSISPVKIDFTIPEKYRGRIHKGARLKFTVEGVSKVYTATVYALEPKIDPATRTLRIRAYAANEDRNVLPGSFAQIEIPVDQNTSVVMVPSEAIIPDIKGQKVFLVKSGKALPVQVEAGLRTENKVQILSGISPGDTVVVSGIMQLKPDAPVRITQVLNNLIKTDTLSK